MRPIEITDLVVGLTTLVLFAAAIGQLDRLRAFALKEAGHALKGWPSHRFFPKGAGYAHREISIRPRKSVH